MHHLNRVIAAILRALRIYEYIPPAPIPAAFRPAEPPAVELPPPDSDKLTPEELVYFQNTPTPYDEDIEPPADYGTMEEPTGCYGIYIPAPRAHRLADDYTFRVHAIAKETLVATGACAEYQAFWSWVRTTKVKHCIDERHVLYSLCRVGDKFILEIASFGHKPQQYYCTPIDLPDDRFTLLDYAWHEPPNDAVKQRQHALDHSRARKG